jgi:uncharacterized surface protein with fasciclin (FAS1) repeats
MEEFNEVTTMTRNRNRYISAAAAAALLMGSASVMSAIGEHEERRTDPTEAYEQQEAQRDQEMQREEEMQRDQDVRTGAATQQEDAWQDEQTQRDQERQVGTGEAAQQLDQLAQQHDNLNTFFRAVQEAGMAEALVGTTEYTIFAPTDEAFEQHDRTPDELMRPENREELISLLRAHIVADDVDPQMARTIGQALTIDGGTVDLRPDQEEEDRFQVGNASVVESDIQQNNLRIYAIDQVLSPGEFAAFEPGATDEEREAETDMQREDDLGRDTDWETQQDPGTGTDTDWETDTRTDTDWDTDTGSDTDW